MLAMSMTAFADSEYVKPAEVYDMAAQCVSRNGEWVVGQDANGSVVYGYNVATGHIDEYGGYTIGNGNCVANNGMIVGQELGANPRGCVMINGKAEVPSTLQNRGLSTIDAITPDGRRVCGHFSGSSTVMQVPFVMDISASGKYGIPVSLPFPRKDFFGDTPQFVNAITISDDGKTIAGFVQDGSGFYSWPIVYTQLEQGNWVYYEPTASLFNPDGLPLPKIPDDVEWGENGAPAPPVFTDYMSPEGMEAWKEALKEDPDASPFDFMSSSENAAYNKAVYEYNRAQLEYLNKIYDQYWAQMQAVGKDEQFVLNQVSLSPDGKWLVVSKGSSGDQPGEVLTGSELWQFNTEDDSHIVIPSPEGTHLLPKSITADGSLIAVTSPSDFFPFTAYILLKGDNSFIPFAEFIETEFPAYWPWLEDSVLTQFGVIGYDPDGKEIYGSYTITGYISVSDDFKVIAGGYPLEPAFSYIFSGEGLSGAVDDIEVEADEEDDAPYYNLQGIRVENPRNGIFIHNGKKVRILSK